MLLSSAQQERIRSIRLTDPATCSSTTWSDPSPTKKRTLPRDDEKPGRAVEQRHRSVRSQSTEECRQRTAAAGETTVDRRK